MFVKWRRRAELVSTITLIIVIQHVQTDSAVSHAAAGANLTSGPLTVETYVISWDLAAKFDLIRIPFHIELRLTA